MTIFITGAMTDLGRELVREVGRQGEAMRLLIRPDSSRAGLELPGVEFVRGSITDLVALRKGMTGCDKVCHLDFVSSSVGDAEMRRINCDGTQTVLQAAQDMRVKSLVQVSDLRLLGPTAADEEADEARIDHAPFFNSPAWQSRHTADNLAREVRSDGLSVKVVYPGMGYGCVRPPGHGGLAEYTLRPLAENKPPIIPGRGRNQLALSYFRDTAQGILLAHELGQAGESYLLTGDLLTWPMLWADIAQVLEQDAQIRRRPRWLARLNGTLPADVLSWATRHWNYSSEKARRELGWRPHSFRQAIEETWQEYQALGIGVDAEQSARAVRRA